MIIAYDEVFREQMPKIKTNPGIARQLLNACEDWSKKQDCKEFASDCELTHIESQEFHQAVGFEEVNRIAAYVRKA